MKAVITVTGKDSVGIIAEVSRLCSEYKANIVDISQTVLDGYFAMILIAEVSGQPVGFLIASVSEPKAGNARPIKQAYLQNIFVEEKMRSAGVGRKLLEELKALSQNGVFVTNNTVKTLFPHDAKTISNAIKNL